MQVSNFQRGDDPVRAAAESVEQQFAEDVYRGWNGLSATWAEDYGINIVAALTSASFNFVRAYGRGHNVMWDLIKPTDQIRKKEGDASEIGFSFRRVAPTTLAAAEELAAQWVREISEETRTQINLTMQEGMARGLPVPKIAQNIKESIGLTEAQAKAVANYRRNLERTIPAKALAYRLRDPSFDDEVGEAVTQLIPLKQPRIDEAVASYYQRYLRYRATTIARFESLFASNAGASSAIQQAVSFGALPSGTVKRWLISRDERTCPVCTSIPEIQPNGVRLDQPFEWRAGTKSGLVMLPPEHPSCRCTITYRAMR